MKTHRVLFVALACLGLLLASPGAGSAASYPSEPIKLLVPFEAGGSSDISARIFAKYAEKELGGRIAIVNMASVPAPSPARKPSRRNPTVILCSGTFPPSLRPTIPEHRVLPGIL